MNSTVITVTQYKNYIQIFFFKDIKIKTYISKFNLKDIAIKYISTFTSVLEWVSTHIVVPTQNVPITHNPCLRTTEDFPCP